VVASNAAEAVVKADSEWMQRALTLAERGLGRTTPNPVVGACVVTDEGVVVGQGAHERAGEPHAEVHALNAAGDRARGATLYCTLEPCAHTGRTGPCTERIIAAGIRRVVAAIQDPDPRVSGRGVAALRERGVQVDLGTERERAIEINLPFLTAKRHGRPFVVLKAAVSRDGCIAARPGERTILTTAAANRHAQYVRARMDGIAVGSETVIVDDPLLTVREVYRERPLARIVLDRRLRTRPEARLFSTLAAGPVIILTSGETMQSQGDRARNLERVGATIVRARGPSVSAMLRELITFDVQSVLLEGGSKVHAAAWDEGVVDAVHLYMTRHVLGRDAVKFLGGRPFSPSSLTGVRYTMRGADVILEGYVHRLD
jgi:diaminohydroxyphosphoribosylaminopyrimidine deaminase/5-amino-6-(5-phosphoribosylamino)uracil reductase